MIVICRNGTFKALSSDKKELVRLKHKIFSNCPYSILEQRYYIGIRCYVLTFARLKSLVVPSLAQDREKMRNK